MDLVWRHGGEPENIFTRVLYFPPFSSSVIQRIDFFLGGHPFYVNVAHAKGCCHWLARMVLVPAYLKRRARHCGHVTIACCVDKDLSGYGFKPAPVKDADSLYAAAFLDDICDGRMEKQLNASGQGEFVEQ